MRNSASTRADYGLSNRCTVDRRRKSKGLKMFKEYVLNVKIIEKKNES